MRILDNIIVDAGHMASNGTNSNRAAIQLLHGPYQNVDIQRNQITDTARGLVLNGKYGLDFQTLAGSVNIRTAKNVFSTLGSGTFAAPVGPLNGVIDTGEILDSQSTTVANAEIFKPDPTRYTRYILTATGAIMSVGLPTIAWAGMQLQFTIRNTSGGTLTVTWTGGTPGHRTAWNNPANGNSASATFAYDGTNWVQINSVSAVPN